MTSNNGTFSAFISYSWDSEHHKKWVKQFASDLRRDCVDAVLDQLHAHPGEQLPAFMERAIRVNDWVLIICTPKYKLKSEERLGAAGYEGDVIAGSILRKKNDAKFITVIRTGSEDTSVPFALLGKYHIYLNDPTVYKAEYKKLVDHLRGFRELPPPLGLPARGNENTKVDDSNIHDPVSDPADFTFENLGLLSPAEVENYLRYYKRLTASGIVDEHAYLGLGVVYLHLCLYDPAIDYLNKALDLAPENAGTHYYLALAEMRGRRPFQLLFKQAQKVARYLFSAIDLSRSLPDAKYYWFLYALNEDFFRKRGFKINHTSSDELIARARDSRCSPHELDCLMRALKISDPAIIKTVSCDGL